MSATAEAKTDIPEDLMERALALPMAARERFAVIAHGSGGGSDRTTSELVRKETKELIADRLEGYLSGRYKAVDAKESIARLLAVVSGDVSPMNVRELPTAWDDVRSCVRLP